MCLVKNDRLLRTFSFSLIIALICCVSSVSAVECGSVPTDFCTVSQNTTFSQGNYSLPSGIMINGNGISLDCNNSILQGSNSGQGVWLRWSPDANTILNCIVKGYQYGFKFENVGGYVPDHNVIFNNTLIGNQGGIYFFGVADHNYIKKNTFYNNNRGIYFLTTTDGASSYNEVTENLFYNSSDSDISLHGNADYNKIWNNSITKRIWYEKTNHNEYVVNGTENIYLNNATGPDSRGLYIYNLLIINTNRTYIPMNYSLPDGISLNFVSGVVLDCNSSISFYGANITGSKGILIRGDSDSNIIKGCTFVNYNSGIYLESVSSFQPEHNYVDGNLFIGNKIGLEVKSGANYNTIYSNSIEKSLSESIKIYSGSAGNKVFLNKFLNNPVNSRDDGSSNQWNSSGQGNYWSNYDSEPEGCFDGNKDLLCDTPFNITGSAGNKDYLPSLGIQINKIIPIQVIEDVDLVNGKRTLVRTNLKNTAIASKVLNVSLYYEDSLKDTNSTVSIESGEEIYVDLWFVPDSSGSNKEIKIEVKEI